MTVVHGARQLTRGLRAAARLLVDVALPPVCSGCGLGGAWLCPRCAELQLPISMGSACRRCGRPLDVALPTCVRCDLWTGSIERVRSAYAFDAAVRTMIHQLKYEGQRARSEWCAAAIADVVESTHWPVDVVVPVPLHRQKERARGFNQSRLIARDLAPMLGLTMNDALVRIRQTRSQIELDAGERRENVRGAFVARRQLRGRHVLLIDDVITTGSTLVECAAACRQAGAGVVFAATVATA